MARAQHPGDRIATLLLGLSYFALGNLVQRTYPHRAVQSFEDAFAIFAPKDGSRQDDADFSNNAGLVRLAQGDFDAADALFAQAIAKAPNHEAALRNRLLLQEIRAKADLARQARIPAPTPQVAAQEASPYEIDWRCYKKMPVPSTPTRRIRRPKRRSTHSKAQIKGSDMLLASTRFELARTESALKILKGDLETLSTQKSAFRAKAREIRARWSGGEDAPVTPKDFEDLLFREFEVAYVAHMAVALEKCGPRPVRRAKRDRWRAWF